MTEENVISGKSSTNIISVMSVRRHLFKLLWPGANLLRMLVFLKVWDVC